jgi:hypothetical protein
MITTMYEATSRTGNQTVWNAPSLQSFNLASDDPGSCEVFPANSMASENDPIIFLDALAARSPTKARQGLAMAINDLIEMTQDWPVEKVREIDGLLEREDLPSLTDTRVRFSKLIRRVVARGVIKSDVEYYAVRNAFELTSDGYEALSDLLATYEASASA